MADPETVEVGDISDIVKIEVPEAKQEPMSVREAVQLLRSLKDKKAVAEAAPNAPEPQESEADEAEDAQPIEAQGEAQEAEPEEVPAIEPPASWKTEEKDRFKSLPPETQAYIKEREMERERLLSRSQNEAAEKSKALSAKEQAVEQARIQYESALPQLLQVLHSQQQGEFADVKTIADVEKLAREDWPRYLQWDVAQKKMAAVQQEMLAAQQRQQQEKSETFNKFANEQDKLFTERAPEMADEKKAEKLKQNAVDVLNDLGFSQTELADSWNGQRDLSLRDHRIQLLIRDAIQWREAQKRGVSIGTQKKPVPPVQRPGAAQSEGAANVARVKQLTEQLQNASGMQATRIAYDLTMAKRALGQTQRGN